MKGKTEKILCGFSSIFPKYLGKYARKMRAGRYETGSEGNLQADGVQSRQTLFVRYCLRYAENKKRLCRREIPVAEPFFCVVFNDTIIHRDMLEIGFPSMRLR